jgi:hypothetical protein
MADDVLLPLVGATLRSNLRDPSAFGVLELEGGGLVLGAVMPAREPGWVVLRCVNRRDAQVRGRWRSSRRIAEAATARLDETRTAPLVPDEAGIEFVAPPRAIVTLLVRWATGG